jgi:thioesterase domain-containing protein
LFLVHPAGGSVFCYEALARQFPLEQPLYGIQAVGLYGEEAVIDNLEVMAARYIGAIRSVQERGPYLLGGWSAGGNIAYEMARQLTQSGETVAFLGLIEAFGSIFGAPVPDHADVLLAMAQDRGIILDQSQVRSLAPDDQIQYLVDAMKGQGHASDDIVSNAINIRNVFQATLQALSCHAAQQYSGRADLFVCEVLPDADHPVDPNHGWRELVAGELCVHGVPGDHLSVVHPPHATALAGQLLAAMGAAVGAS